MSFIDQKVVCHIMMSNYKNCATKEVVCEFSKTAKINKFRRVVPEILLLTAAAATKQASEEGF